MYEISEMVKPIRKLSSTARFILALVVAGISAAVDAAGINVPVSKGHTTASLRFRICIINNGKLTTLPSGGVKCCLGQYCTICNKAECILG